VAATIKVLDEMVLVDRWMPKTAPPVGATTELVYIDQRSVVNPGTGKRNIRYRVAVSPKWKAVFTLRWDNSVVGEREMEAVIRDSGTLVGLGSGRDIGLGRFVLTLFETIHDDAKKPTAKRSLDKDPRKSVAARRT
jgi:hypothetical protein